MSDSDDDNDNDGCASMAKYMLIGAMLLLGGCVVPDGGGTAPPMEGANWACIIPIAMAAILLAVVIMAAGNSDNDQG